MSEYRKMSEKVENYKPTLPAVTFRLFNDLRNSLSKSGGMNDIVEGYKQYYPQFTKK